MSSSLETLMVLIPALPLLAAIVIALLGPRVLKEKSHLPAAAAIGTAFVLSLFLLFAVRAELPDALHETADDAATNSEHTCFEHTLTLWTWANVADAYQPGEAASGLLRLPTDAEPAAASDAPGSNAQDGGLDFRIDVTLRADPLTSIMLSMVLFVSTLVVIYASGYMHGDPGYPRFFVYVSLFVFSMTMLVSVSNFALLYVFWEAVGVCSYLLIGFWYQKPEAAAAGKKAFLVNRIGDFGFALGVFLIWVTYGTLNFHDAEGIGGVLGQARLASGQFVAGTVGLSICLLLFVGACGKSAQFPLHVWLPDAMEGPTPVSALIHAATMVTAGVYLVARSTPLFFPMTDVPGAWFQQAQAHEVVAVIGTITALLAGLIALTQTDLKRILAYSTVSQLGFMFLGLGVGSLMGVVAGMFHLFTHAFFKALLFLGAGSVMHAMGNVIDIRRFGGLRKVMPVTHLTFLCGSLALAGVVPFAGFWSKDAIVAAVHARAHDGSQLFEILYYVALVTAWMTAFYTFRAFFWTFYGEVKIPPEAGHHAHESPLAMTLPLVILAACSAGVGAYFEWTHGFADFLAQTPSLAYRPLGPVSHEFHADVASLSTLIALAGVGLAAFLYLGNRSEIGVIARIMQGLRLYPLSYGKFFFDQIYQWTIVMPLLGLAQISAWFDRTVVDGLVNWVGQVPLGIGSVLRALQMGLVQFYALSMVLGVLVLLIAMLLW